METDPSMYVLAMSCLDSIQKFFSWPNRNFGCICSKTLWRYDEIESGVLTPIFSSGLEDVIKNILRSQFTQNSNCSSGRGKFFILSEPQCHLDIKGGKENCKLA